MLTSFKQKGDMMQKNLKLKVNKAYSRAVSLFSRAKNRIIPPPPILYNGLGFTTDHSTNFSKDEKFKKALAKVKSRNCHAWFNEDKSKFDTNRFFHHFHTASWCAEYAISNNLSLIEGGVAYGATSTFICEFYDLRDFSGDFFLVDTYEGIVPEQLRTEELGQLGKNGRLYPTADFNNYELIKKNFNEYSCCKVIKGVIPEVLNDIPFDDHKRFGYCHIDMNCVLPEIELIKWVWPRMVSGGRILLDDYGWQGHYLQRDAFDEFLRPIGIHVLTLPTGQGLIIMP
jgi:hypothetical protein